MIYPHKLPTFRCYLTSPSSPSKDAATSHPLQKPYGTTKLFTAGNTLQSWKYPTMAPNTFYLPWRKESAFYAPGASCPKCRMGMGLQPPLHHPPTSVKNGTQSLTKKVLQRSRDLGRIFNMFHPLNLPVCAAGT